MGRIASTQRYGPANAGSDEEKRKAMPGHCVVNSVSGQQGEAISVQRTLRAAALTTEVDTRRPATEETSTMQAVGCKKGSDAQFVVWWHRFGNA